MTKPPLFSVGWHKGEMDFAVLAEVENLSYESMRSLREMIVVGIGVMEEMWRRAREKEQPHRLLDGVNPYEVPADAV